MSTSVVSHALFPLRELGIVKIKKLRSEVVDFERFLFFWGTRRNLKKDIIYKTFSPLPVMEIEASMPADVIPTAYAAHRFIFNDPPADYDKVYFYSKNFTEVKNRFGENNKKYPNIFILKQDPFLKKYGNIAPLAQIFVDLWNLEEWFAKDFYEDILLRIREKFGL